MLINLYGNIVNPYNIARVMRSTGGDGYLIIFNGIINANATHSNILEISAETVQTVDETSYHTPSEIYMLNMINKLERLANTSAKKEIENNGGKTS